MWNEVKVKQLQSKFGPKLNVMWRNLSNAKIYLIYEEKERRCEDMTPEYMSLTDAAKYLGYGSKHVVYDLIREGMPVIKVGKTMRVSKTAIDAFMKAHEVVDEK